MVLVVAEERRARELAERVRPMLGLQPRTLAEEQRKQLLVERMRLGEAAKRVRKDQERQRQEDEGEGSRKRGQPTTGEAGEKRVKVMRRCGGRAAAAMCDA